MVSKKMLMLSKTRFQAGLQCPLRLWHTCYNPDLASEASPVQQAIFDTGHEVGRLATQRYPGGVLIEEDHLHHQEAVESTLVAMGDPKVRAIYEAGFLYQTIGQCGFSVVYMCDNTKVSNFMHVLAFMDS